MRKFVLGAFALVMLSSLVSCKETETETSGEQAELNVETPMMEEETEAAPAIDTMETETTVNDSIPATEEISE